MNNQNKTKEEKRKALDHLYYEAWMFREAYNKLIELDQQEADRQLEFNFAIEIFALHLRNLIYVFEDRSDDRDVKCSDFNIAKQTIKLPENNNLLKIDKFLSHLTWDRGKMEKPKWDLKIREEIKNEIKNALGIFINNCLDGLFPTERHYRKEDFKTLLL